VFDNNIIMDSGFRQNDALRVFLDRLNCQLSTINHRPSTINHQPSTMNHRPLHKTVIALGVVSFFTDFSSEMIYPLLPVFLTTTLGAGALALGIIEGIAESISSILKIISGLWSDRVTYRKPFILAGYGIAGLFRPLIGLAYIWPVVLILRFFDRIGKGLRTSPRDVLIAEVTDPAIRGKAFGFHRAMDHAGAVAGPLAAAALLTYAGISLRQVFLLAAIPAVIVILVIISAVKEEPRKTELPSSADKQKGGWPQLTPNYKLYLFSLLVFTLGNSTDAFILLKLTDSGIPASWIAVLWAAFHIVKMISSYFGGMLSDKIGRKVSIISGWMLYSLVYCAFAFVSSATASVIVFMIYGLYFGLTESSEKAWVADLSPANLRGAAFGFYNGVIGLGALPASIIFGLIWKLCGAHIAFFTGSVLSFIACLVLLQVKQAGIRQ